jgi:hypothetical protein
MLFQGGSYFLNVNVSKRGEIHYLFCFFLYIFGFLILSIVFNSLITKGLFFSGYPVELLNSEVPAMLFFLLIMIKLLKGL